MRPLERIQEDLDEAIERAQNWVDYLKAQAHQRPWAFVSGGMLPSLVVGLVLGGNL